MGVSFLKDTCLVLSLEQPHPNPVVDCPFAEQLFMSTRTLRETLTESLANWCGKFGKGVGNGGPPKAPTNNIPPLLATVF